MGKIGFFWDELPNNGKMTLEDKFSCVGQNTGNLVFVEALKSILNLAILPLNSIENADKFDHQDFSAFITTELIWLQYNRDLDDKSHLRDVLRFARDKPVIPISIGLQTSDFIPDFKLHPQIVCLLSEISERCVMGVRGYYTADILNKHGITNIQVIGCPSLYYQMNPEFQLNKKDFDDSFQVVSNMETFYRSLPEAQLNFLLYAMDFDMAFLEQVNLPLLREYTPDSVVYEKLAHWMALQKKIFFDFKEWREWGSKFNFSIGGRFHGNVIEVLCGIPSLFLVVDSRTKEMCEFFGLPHMPMDQFDRSKPLEYYYNLADYSMFNQMYRNRVSDFQDFLIKNGLCPLPRNGIN